MSMGYLACNTRTIKKKEKVMELQDKLSRDERIRLECLAQAVHLYTMKSLPPLSETIINMARRFEKFVSDG